ncbi:MAG: fumarylacetoacetate hydrolase family protein, partial [Cyclobacteriaceae bacterium]|nr:fumarylacetoacetate hydrolase family protein [Cyclobacteriaceae bacterium]
EIISYISKFIMLKKGDIIFTGTPKGVGPIAIGNKLEAFIENEKLLEVEIK